MSPRTRKSAALRRRPAVLVVDDDAATREMLGLALQPDFDVREAPDGPTALELVRNGRFDCILLDMLMPDMQGLEVLARIRDQRAETPVIALSGLDMAATATEAMKLGAFDYVIKPSEPGRLVELIWSAIEGPRRRLEAEPSLRRTAAPAARAEGVLLVGRDVPFLASLKIALTGTVPAAVASTVVGVLRRLARHQPALALIDDSLDWNDLKEVARVLRVVGPRCTVLIGCSPERDTTAIAELAAHAPYALMAKPYDFNELLERIQSLCALGQPLPHAWRLLSAHVTRAMAYVCRHYHVATSEGTAQAAGVSSGHLAHSFRAELDMTFWDFVTAMRLEVAKDLLSETNYKQEHIAQLVGFSDGPHLSRVFRHHVGQSPGLYRESMLGIDPRPHRETG